MSDVFDAMELVVTSLDQFRNSEGLTPAESWRKDAARLDNEAASLARQAAQARTNAFGYRQMADEWDAEHGV